MTTDIRAAASLLHHSSKERRSRPLISTDLTSYLSLNARPIHNQFDDDGPGSLARLGARHNNDHIHIKNIKILPTVDECLSVRRPPYVPKKSLRERHHLETGPSRLLDTLFRQLRYESTESLRDICYTAAQELYLDMSPQYVADYLHRKETRAERRYYAYRNASIENMFPDEQQGLLLQISYDCPQSMKEHRIKSSGRLEEGMLCALIGIDGIKSELSITFFEIDLRQSTFAMNAKGGENLRAAVQVSFAEKDSSDDLLRMIRHVQGIDSSRFLLVEFPGALYAGFCWHLRKLQQLQMSDIAFAKRIVPLPDSNIIPTISLSEPGFGGDSPPLLSTIKPAYTERQGYEVDLKPVTGIEQKLPISAFEVGSRGATVDFIMDYSSLDEGQAMAFCDTMTREVAFTQGPPGTGKTFLGVALARTILASRLPPNFKPILVVCLTNHALDSFLKGLIDAGVKSIARIGGGSREDWTKQYLLKTISRKMKKTDEEFHDKRDAELKRRDAHNEMRGLSEALIAERKTGTISWFAVRKYLKDSHPKVYEQLVTDIDSAHAQSFAFQYWAGGGDLRHLKQLEIELKTALNQGAGQESDVLDIQTALDKIAIHVESSSAEAETNVWRYNLEQRQSLLKDWGKEVDRESLSHELVDLQLDHVDADQALLEARNSIHARCLKGQNVIGMTTTACARNYSLLKKLDLEVVMCEEAAEVMEPHTICSLFQSIEHAIFIGDPLQLRPQVEEKLLKTELDMGPEYRLDESLFEKFMCPRDPDIIPMPVSQLDIQRRMHPSIAEITRLTYPYLLNHSATASHPPTEGMAHRIFWFHHTASETSPLNSVTKSYSNDFEAAMIFGLVRYLLRGGAYALGEIAVITAYKGQLALLKRMFQGTCPVWLHPKDREALIDDGFVEQTSSEVREEIPMSEMLRMATVDNFQGEEAKIIIVSLVRSLKPGFLATENRINVMCSRARNGLYIFGNAELLQCIPMWRDIVQIFRNHDAVGSMLRTTCLKHPQHSYDIVKPADFDKVQDCASLCMQTRNCGHVCTELCHAAPHDTLPCKEACIKKHEDCDHVCTRLCSEPCGSCTAVVGTRQLDCGHFVDIICPENVQPCTQVIDEIDIACGHKLRVLCHETSIEQICREICGEKLPCGHDCPADCAECHASRPIAHPPCSAVCGKELQCGHKCAAECHNAQVNCPPCSQRCQKSCPHGRCKNKCSTTCDPCVKPQRPPCQHLQSMNTLCSLPSPTLPCDHQCEQTLTCGHKCSSLCGEVCLNAEDCLKCGGRNASLISTIRLECGHVFPVAVLDSGLLDKIYLFSAQNGMSGIHERPELTGTSCPSCDAPITRKSPRYAVVDQLLHASDNVDRLIGKIGRNMQKYGHSLHTVEQNLRGQIKLFTEAIRPNPLAAPQNASLIQDRGRQFTELQKDIVKCKEMVVTPFEESMRVLQIPFREFIGTYVFTFALRFDLLACRTKAAWATDDLRMARFLSMCQDPSLELPRAAEVLRHHSIIVCREGRDMCAEGIRQAVALKAPCLELEFLLQAIILDHLDTQCVDSKFQHARHPPAEPKATQTEHVKRARDLIKSYPNTAGRFSDVFNDLTKCLKAPRLEPPTLYTLQSRGNEIKWGQHEIGHLTKCKNGHPFSSKTFEVGCPECEPKVMSAEEAFQQTEKKFREVSSFVDWNRRDGENERPVVKKGVFDPLSYGLGKKMRVENEKKGAVTGGYRRG